MEESKVRQWEKVGPTISVAQGPRLVSIYDKAAWRHASVTAIVKWANSS